jgi:uncharacterized protein YqjF (DUF2071 family)
MVSFLHWPVDPDRIARLLPPGLVPDLWDGSAWIGVTPFTTTCEVLAAYPLPGPTHFPETNVRTYVRASDGTSGIWFLSLDVPNRANAMLGRAGRIPYFEADMSVDAKDGRASSGSVRYRGRRRGRSDVQYDITIAPTGAPAHDSFASYLVDRWSAYVAFGPALVRVDVEHEPWPLQQASALELDETLTRAAGLTVPLRDPAVHHAAGVDARLSWPRLIRFSVSRSGTRLRAGTS